MCIDGAYGGSERDRERQNGLEREKCTGRRESECEFVFGCVEAKFQKT